MHILMLSDVYFPRINGVSTSIQTFRSSLQAMGHRVTLVVPAYGSSHDEDDTDIIRIASRRIPFDPEDRLMSGRAIKRLARQFQNESIDLVHIQTPFVAHYAGLSLARALDCPVVESYHTFFEEYLYNYIPFLPKAFLKWCARHFSRSQCNQVDQIIVPSSAMRNVLKHYGITQPLRVLPTGLPDASYLKGNGVIFRQQHGIPTTRPILIHVGRVAFEKNIHFLLDMLTLVKETIPDILLVIAGEGPAVPQLNKHVGKLGLTDNVTFIGYLKRDGELADCYCAGDLFVFASRTETQGLVLLEAMALGIPVVSTAVMGTKDILRPVRGAVVAEENEQDFAGKIVRLLQDKKQRELLSQDAIAYALGWSSEQLARQLEELYAQACNQASPAILYEAI